MVNMFTVLVNTISYSQVFLLKKCEYSHFFSRNISIYAILNDLSFNDTLTNDIVSVEQLGPDEYVSYFFANLYVLSTYWKCLTEDFLMSIHNICFCGAGWSGGAKVLCILHHWGVQLILAYIWARPAILVVDKSRGGMFLFLLFLHFHSYSSFFPVPLFHLLYSLFYLFSPFLWETTQNDPQGLTCR